MEALIKWFIAKEGTIDQSAIGFKEFADLGRGAVALRDIDVRKLPSGFTFQILTRPYRVGGPYSLYHSTFASSVYSHLLFEGGAGGGNMGGTWTWMDSLDTLYDVGADEGRK